MNSNQITKIKNYQINRLFDKMPDLKNTKKNIFSLKAKTRLDINPTPETSPSMTQNIFHSTKISNNNSRINYSNKRGKIKLPSLNKSNMSHSLYQNFCLKNGDIIKCIAIPKTLNYYGLNNIKISTTKEIIKMNNNLLRNSLVNLTKSNKPSWTNNSSFKIKKINRGSEKKKSNNAFKKIFNSEDTRNKKKKLSLYERELVKKKLKYNQMMKSKFIELEKCEKKFDVVITDTLQKLDEAEKNLYNI